MKLLLCLFLIHASAQAQEPAEGARFQLKKDYFQSQGKINSKAKAGVPHCQFAEDGLVQYVRKEKSKGHEEFVVEYIRPTKLRLNGKFCMTGRYRLDQDGIYTLYSDSVVRKPVEVVARKPSRYRSLETDTETSEETSAEASSTSGSADSTYTQPSDVDGQVVIDAGQSDSGGQ